MPRLQLQPLEERLTPAYNLSINGDALTSGITVNTSVAGLTQFTANANDAVLNVADIAAALRVGNVQILTNTTGTQFGDIDWFRNSNLDDLIYLGAATRTLTLRTNDTGTNPDILADDIQIIGNDNLHVVFDSSDDQSVEMDIVDARSVTVEADDVLTFAGPSALTSVSGTTQILANTMNVFSAVTLKSLGLWVNVNAPITLGVGRTLSAFAPEYRTTFYKAIDGPGSLVVGSEITEFLSTVGAATPLNSITVQAGLVDTTTTLRATTVNIGDNILSGDNVTSYGTVQAELRTDVQGNVKVKSDGVLAPGYDATATLNITGNLEITGGEYRFSYDTGADLVQVGGTVSLSTAKLTSDSLYSTFNFAGSVGILTHGGTMSGSFWNAPPMQPLVLAMDAVQVIAYETTAGGAVWLRAAAVVEGNTYRNYDSDGTAYTVRLTGPGELIAMPSLNGSQLDIVVRNSTLQSKLAVVSQANGSDGEVRLGSVAIKGDLAAFNAPTALLDGSFKAMGILSKLTLRRTQASTEMIVGHTDFFPMQMNVRQDLFGQLNLFNTKLTLNVGGNIYGTVSIDGAGFGRITASNHYGRVETNGVIDQIRIKNDSYGGFDGFEGIGTIQVGGQLYGEITSGNGRIGSIKAKSLSGSLFAGMGIGTITCQENIDAAIIAGKIGTIQTKGVLRATSPWNIFNGGITMLRAGQIKHLDGTAAYITNIIVSPTPNLGADGSMEFCDLTLTGSNGDYGLKKVQVKNRVYHCTFNVLTGSVGTVTVGRFLNSKLHVGFAGGLANGFTSNVFKAGTYRLEAFKTTAVTQEPGNPYGNYAFANSEILAETLGTVRLSGVQTANNTTLHGIKYRNGTPSIRIAACDGALPLNTDLTSGAAPLADDFCMYDV